MLYVLDENMKIILYDVPYTNLVWNSRWYDIGEFQMQVPTSLVGDSWKYITSTEHDEIGVIQKREYDDSDGGYYLLSGMFSEVMLNNGFSYEASSDITTSFTDAINHIVTEWYVELEEVSDQFPIRVAAGDTIPGGTIDIALKNGTPLADFLYEQLMQKKASYRIRMRDNKPTFEVRAGRSLDLTLDSSFGDIVNVTGSIDNSSYKNIAIVFKKDGYGFVELVVTREGETIPEGHQKRIFMETSEKDDAKIIAKAREELSKHNVTVDLDADILDVATYESIIQLGDEITLNVPEMGMNMRTRIVELTTIYNDKGKSVKVGFGDKRVPNVKRLVETWQR